MNKRYLFFAAGLLISGIMVSCGSGDTEKKDLIDKEVLDPNSSLNTNFDGEIFSIPSPMQTALLLKSVNAPFNEGYLNSLDNVGNYTTEAKKALNLGVYGTDLGYISIYKQNSLSLKYLAAVEKMTSSLGLESAFDKSFMSRFEKNSTNEDSMMVIVSDAFKKADNFLKSNKRKETSALILVGGWVESMYIATMINKEKGDQKIVQRIGEQTQTLSTIIEILKKYNSKGQHKELLGDMEDLKKYFDQISIVYIYNAPKTDAKNKITTLQHEMSVSIDSNLLNFINEKISSIRTKITA
jgi:hypothetical protein